MPIENTSFDAFEFLFHNRGGRYVGAGLVKNLQKHNVEQLVVSNKDMNDIERVDTLNPN